MDNGGPITLRKRFSSQISAAIAAELTKGARIAGEVELEDPFVARRERRHVAGQPTARDLQQVADPGQA